MSLYVNNAGNEPSSIYYNGNELNTVYFNGNLVWEKVVGDDWQEIINTIEKKANGEIDNWPYGTHKRFTILLNKESDYWGKSVEIILMKKNDNSLIFAVEGGPTTYYNPDDLMNYHGYTNSIPRAKCQELANLLPFKNYIIPKTSENSAINVLTVNGTEIGEVESIPNSIDTDYIFCLNVNEFDNEVYGDQFYDTSSRASGGWMRTGGHWLYKAKTPCSVLYAYGQPFHVYDETDFTSEHGIVGYFELGA